jgi:hypothetical protein
MLVVQEANSGGTSATFGLTEGNKTLLESSELGLNILKAGTGKRGKERRPGWLIAAYPATLRALGEIFRRRQVSSWEQSGN